MARLDRFVGYLQNKSQQTEDLDIYQKSLLKTFSFTSVGGGTGASTILLYVAQYFAKELNKQVCVVDLNFLQPDLLYNMNVDVTTENTILNYLKGVHKLEKCFIQDKSVPNLRLVTASPTDDVVVLANIPSDRNKIGNLINELDMFDYVFINLPYVQPFITFLEPLEVIDKGFLVMDERLSSIRKMKMMLEFIQVFQSRGNAFNNVILNKRTKADYPFERLEEESCNIVTAIPFNDSLVHALNNKKSLISQSFPKGVVEGFTDIIETILE